MSTDLGKKVIDNFIEINKIPRGSRNEAGISKHMLEFGNGLGLKSYTDDANNVIIVKPAQNTDHTDPIILQAHMDMVCAVDDAHKDYDFIKNPIYPKQEDNIMTGRGTKDGVYDDSIKTTLGADDGIGVASVMALLQDEGTITHPPLIAIFTTGEEIGMVGAKKLTKQFIEQAAKELDLSKARLINVDEEQDGRFCYGCAGGVGVELTLNFSREKEVMHSDKAYKISISGLLGGHSGIDIDKRRANANRLAGRILYYFIHTSEIDVALYQIKGGSAENAIAAGAETVISVSEQDTGKLQTAFEEIYEDFKKEYHEVETGMSIVLEETTLPENMPILKEDRDRIVKMIYLMPNDVLGFLQCDGYSVVETSSNLGIINTNDETIVFECSIRSFYDVRRDFVASQMELLSQLFNFSIYTHDDYSGWAQSPDSKLKEVFEDSYKYLFPNDPVGGRSVHAGLECGVFTGILGDIDMIACGPTIHDVHTIKETLYLDTVPKIIELLIEVLKRLSA